MMKEDEELRRVLLELSMTSNGELEVRMDPGMKPLTVLAVTSALDSLSMDLKELVSWGGKRE